MFLNFRKRNKEQNKIEIIDQPVDYSISEINTFTKKIPELSISEKIVFLKTDNLTKLPEKYKDQNNNVTYFNFKKYYSAAQQVYDDANLDNFIKNIEIVNMLDAGLCITEIINNKLVITIRISLSKLGIIEHSGYIYEYSEEQCKIFVDTLAHELSHAKDNIAIVQKYGISEYKSISSNKLAVFARDILSEYSACRETAEKYSCYDSAEKINAKIEHKFNNIKLSLSQKNTDLLNLIQSLNYTISTRLAFADVSNDEKHIKVPDYLKNHEKYSNYIQALRSLLGKYYVARPLSMKDYEELGHKMFSELMDIIFGINDNQEIQLLISQHVINKK